MSDWRRGEGKKGKLSKEEGLLKKESWEFLL